MGEVKLCSKSCAWVANGALHGCSLFICDKCGCWKFVNPKNGNCFYTDKEAYDRKNRGSNE